MSSTALKSEAAITSPSILPEAAELDKLSLEQRFALMQMSDWPQMQAVYRKLREDIQIPPFSVMTFAELRELGFAVRPKDQRFHSLTAQGRNVASLVAMNFIKEKNIHAGYVGGNVGSTTTILCTCGWSCAVRRGCATSMAGINAFGQHLRTITAINGLADVLAPKTNAKAG